MVNQCVASPLLTCYIACDIALKHKCSTRQARLDRCSTHIAGLPDAGGMRRRVSIREADHVRPVRGAISQAALTLSCGRLQVGRVADLRHRCRPCAVAAC